MNERKQKNQTRRARTRAALAVTPRTHAGVEGRACFFAPAPASPSQTLSTLPLDFSELDGVRKLASMSPAAPLQDVMTLPWPPSMEASVHACPRRHREEIDAVFPGLGYEGLLVIPTCQQASLDLVNVGVSVEKEKDELLERFFAFAKAFCACLQAEGHWADYIDPCSGLPMVHKMGAGIYGEVDALVTLLRYSTVNAGC